MLGRMYGLASDQILSLDMVDASGDIITADASNNSDLLFASQGALSLSLLFLAPLFSELFWGRRNGFNIK